MNNYPRDWHPQTAEAGRVLSGKILYQEICYLENNVLLCLYQAQVKLRLAKLDLLS